MVWVVRGQMMTHYELRLINEQLKKPNETNITMTTNIEPMMTNKSKLMTNNEQLMKHTET